MGLSKLVLICLYSSRHSSFAKTTKAVIDSCVVFVIQARKFPEVILLFLYTLQAIIDSCVVFVIQAQKFPKVILLFLYTLQAIIDSCVVFVIQAQKFLKVYFIISVYPASVYTLNIVSF